MGQIYWTAKNNSSFLNGYRMEKTLLAATRAARKYVQDELCGEGCITYYNVDPNDADPMCPPLPIRKDEKSIFTNYRWKVI